MTEPCDLDLRHLRCPLPVLHTARALRRLEPNSVLIVRCTDPLAAIDIPHLVQQTGDVLLSSERGGDTLVFRIRKAGRDAPLSPDPPVC